MHNRAGRPRLAEIEKQLTFHFNLVSALLNVVLQQEILLGEKIAGKAARLNKIKRAMLQEMQANAKAADNLNREWLRIRRRVRLSERFRLEEKIKKIVNAVEEIFQKEKAIELRIQHARHVLNNGMLIHLG